MLYAADVMALPQMFETNVVRFKDGERAVPEWQLPMLSGLDTEEMTYQEFVSKMNGLLLKRATSDAMLQHLRGQTTFGRYA